MIPWSKRKRVIWKSMLGGTTVCNHTSLAMRWKCAIVGNGFGFGKKGPGEKNMSACQVLMERSVVFEMVRKKQLGFSINSKLEKGANLFSQENAAWKNKKGKHVSCPM